MKIFVSYKRLDKKKVFDLVETIERKTGQECWIDLTGIESDKQFVDVIIKAINKAEVVLFMYSANHLKITDYEHDWTVRELDFASDKKKRIVFVNLDRSALSDWFLFNFGRKEQVFADDPEALDRLCKDICGWLGCSAPVPSPNPSPASGGSPASSGNSEDRKIIEPDYLAEALRKSRRSVQGTGSANSGGYGGLRIRIVDLGLPSGTKWADCNIGARTPGESGSFFAWGEVQSKTVFSWNNYEYRCGGTSQEDVLLTKYCTRSKRGPVDNKERLDPNDDAATVQLGKQWRIPTIAEWQELFDNCTLEWNEHGYLLTSKINHSFIFLPAAGYVGGFPSEESECGYYWSATLDNYDPANAWMVFFKPGGIHKLNKGDRYAGFSIRAVTG